MTNYNNVIFILLMMNPVFLMAQIDITDCWLTEDENSIIEIFKENDNTVGGKVVWLKEPLDANGETRKDELNRASSLKGREVMGMQVLENLTYENGLWKGSIYVAKRGRTLDVELSAKKDDELQVEVSFRGFSRTQTWTKTEKSK